MTSTSSRSSPRIRPNDGGPAAPGRRAGPPSGTPPSRRGCWRRADPAREAQPVPEVDEVRDQLAVLLAALDEVVRGDEPVRRAGQAR